jgi:hypothetical protein
MVGVGHVENVDDLEAAGELLVNLGYKLASADLYLAQLGEDDLCISHDVHYHIERVAGNIHSLVLVELNPRLGGESLEFTGLHEVGREANVLNIIVVDVVGSGSSIFIEIFIDVSSHSLLHLHHSSQHLPRHHHLIPLLVEFLKLIHGFFSSHGVFGL